MEKDLVYLVWTERKTGNKYKVAELYKQGNTFYFKYILENVKEAQKAGFKLLVAFPQINALYDNPKLFANFAARLPEPTRPEIKELDLLEKDFNSKLNNLYEELNNKIASILPIDNKDVMEECRQCEPNYINETTFYIDPINKYDIGVQVAGDFRFRNFVDLNHFISFYEENKSKYIIVDEYDSEFTLDEFLKEVNFK